MNVQSRDLTIDSVLADPIISALMKADRVDPVVFERLLRGKARQVSSPSRAPLVPTSLLAAAPRRAGWRACFA